MRYLICLFLVVGIAAIALGFAGTSPAFVRVASGMFITAILFSGVGALLLYIHRRRRAGPKLP